MTNVLLYSLLVLTLVPAIDGGINWRELHRQQLVRQRLGHQPDEKFVLVPPKPVDPRGGDPRAAGPNGASDRLVSEQDAGLGLEHPLERKSAVRGVAFRDLGTRVTAPLQPNCSFVVVVNDYSPRDPALIEEYMLVAKSWMEAIQTARDSGQNITVIATKLPTDQWSLPPSFFALGDVVEVPVRAKPYLDARGKSLPTIGGILTAAKEALRNDLVQIENKHMVFMNRDIGLFPHFFISACRILSKPGVRSFEVTRLGLNQTLVDQHGLNISMFGDHIELHPGHDMFVFPVEDLHDCIVSDRRLLVGYPPWGIVFAAVLRSLAKANHQEYLFLSGTHRRRLTFHLNREDDAEVWRTFLSDSRSLLAMLLSGAMTITNYTLSAETFFGRHAVDAMKPLCENPSKGVFEPFCSMCTFLFPNLFLDWHRGASCKHAWDLCPDPIQCIAPAVSCPASPDHSDWIALAKRQLRQNRYRDNRFFHLHD